MDETDSISFILKKTENGTNKMKIKTNKKKLSPASCIHGTYQAQYQVQMTSGK